MEKIKVSKQDLANANLYAAFKYAAMYGEGEVDEIPGLVVPSDWLDRVHWITEDDGGYRVDGVNDICMDDSEPVSVKDLFDSILYYEDTNWADVLLDLGIIEVEDEVEK